MLTTTHVSLNATITHGGDSEPRSDNPLLERYDSILKRARLNWTSHHALKRKLGAGGQGVVYLSERRGADGFTLPVAVKVFSPERFEDERSYDDAMIRLAQVSARVAQIQHDNLLDVHNFVDRERIRMMVMEWVDGYDLSELMVRGHLSKIEGRVSARRWEYINRVIMTFGPVQPRFKAGVAVAVVHECLGALAALHRDGIVHGDIKPSNIMLKRTGNAKIVDIGSAFEVKNPPAKRSCTPAYAAPEVLEGNECTQRSDLASLGYTLLEMLSGRPLFRGAANLRELLEAKRALPHKLGEILPQEVTVNELLMNFCRGLVAPDPMMRFPTAEAADLRQGGAAAFLRQLVMSNMSSEYDNEIRVLLEEMRELDDRLPPDEDDPAE